MEISQAYDNYVSTHYKRAHGADYQKIARGFEPVYLQLLPLDRDSKILDIGCGLGEFLVYLDQKGFTNTEGLEVGTEQIALASQRTGAKLHGVSESEVLDFLIERSGRYDFVVMNHVLEHLPKHQILPLLGAVHEALKPGGKLVVTTDNPAPLSGFLSRYNDFTHQLIFTELSLQQALELAKFEQVHLVIPRYPRPKTLRGWVGRLARELWFVILKGIYYIERPGDYRPKNFSIPLAAYGVKPAQEVRAH